MMNYIIRRCILAIPTLLLLVTLVFFVVRVLPGDPASILAGIDATPAQIEQLRRVLGLDKPLLVQYVRFIGDLLQGSLGDSTVTGAPVRSEIAARLPYTLSVAVLAIVLASALGIFFGIIAGLRRGTWIDTTISAFAVVGLSMPAYWLGLLLIILFSVWLKILPAGGTDGAFAFVLPTLVLVTYPLGVIVRITRASILEVLHRDYIRTARAKGIRGAALIYHHALQNALLPMITIIGLLFGSLLSGSVLTETVFSWPGIGRLLVSSILNRDYPVVVGVVLLFAVLITLVNLVTDILYGIIDPRVRYE